jgi:hypothetical protein
MQQPTVGRIVHYQLHDSDADQVNRRRADASAFRHSVRQLATQPQSGERGRTGHVEHFGNEVSEGSVYPAVVVAVFGNGEHVNLKVLLDGNDDYWATSRPEGDTPGTWAWPPRA